jgi:hypothetical protein
MGKRTYGRSARLNAILKWLTVMLAAGVAMFGALGASGFESYKSSKNYCGPKVQSVPNQPIPGVNFNQACYEHDKCYGMCASNCMTQAMCDNDFRNRMLNHCKSRALVIRPACNNLAEVYYQAVHTAGGPISYNCGSPPCADSTQTLPMGTPGVDTAYVFEHANYAGASAEWSKGTSISDLTKWNTPTGAKWNDRISSLKVGSGVRVLAYENINFGGRCITFSSARDYDRLDSQNANLSGRENWNDRISSLKVTPPNVSCP